jgi:hypothetical protein
LLAGTGAAPGHGDRLAIGRCGAATILFGVLGEWSATRATRPGSNCLPDRREAITLLLPRSHGVA